MTRQGEPMSSDALSGFDLLEQRGARAADLLETVFQRLGDEIERSLSKAARTGSIAFDEMAQSILLTLAKIAFETLVIDRLAPSGASPAMAVMAQRPVDPKAPMSAALRGAPIVNVTINAGPSDAVAAVHRSRSQIAAAIARAVSEGGRKL